MKLAKSQLKQIIKEEYDSAIEEYGIDRFGHMAKARRKAVEVEKNLELTETFENTEQLKAYIQGRIDKMPDIDQNKKSHILKALRRLDTSEENLAIDKENYEVTPLSLALGYMTLRRGEHHWFKGPLRELGFKGIDYFVDLADHFWEEPEGWKPEYATVAGGEGGAYMVNEDKMKLTKSQLKQIIREELKKIGN